MPDPGAKIPSWSDHVEVEERRLQEYMCQKNHTITLRGACEALQHTLEPMPTTTAEDGLVHFGDSLMLRSSHTEGLLLADVQDMVEVSDAGTEPRGPSVSTAKLLKACPRNVFTISRVSDSDGFGETVYLHYGQPIRFSTSTPCLSEKPFYLFGSEAAVASADADEGEKLACLHRRASSKTHWIVCPLAQTEHSEKVVALETPFRLVSVATGCCLRSDFTIHMNNYGNELRVFSSMNSDLPPDVEKAESATWSFVNTHWADQIVEGARAKALALLDNDAFTDYDATTDRGVDAGELLRDPLYRAEVELKALENEGGASMYGVVLRIYPILRRAGMHVVRSLRRMCISADTQGKGTLPSRTFEGVLSWLGIRLQATELEQLIALFEPEDEKNNAVIDYERFFALLAPKMNEVRASVVRDAYRKLQGLAAGGYVQVLDLQRTWNPRCHPCVQQGTLSEAEALEDFLRQWDIVSADGLVSYEEFFDYYRDVGMAVEADEIFVEIVRAGWRL